MSKIMELADAYAEFCGRKLHQHSEFARAALQAEVERLQVDAERYLWLRDYAPFLLLEEVMDVETGRNPRTQLDAAIDAARSKT